MTTILTKTTTATDTILAIDLGKYKSVACLYRSAGDQHFTTFATRRLELTRLIDKHRPAVILFEACLLAGWVCDLCVEKGVPCLVANTSSEAWKFKHLQRKTDRDDALRLADVYRLGKFPSVAIPQKEIREQRGLIETRQKLVGRRVALQNRIRAVLVSQGLPAPCGAKAWTEIGLAGIAAHARPIAVCGPLELWRGRLHLALTELAQVKQLLDQAEKKLDELAKADATVQLLETIPGVGKILALILLYEIHDSARFADVGRLLSYACLVRGSHESAGKKKGAPGKKIGNAHLQWAFGEAACLFVRHCERAKIWLQRKEKKHGTAKALAILAAQLGRTVYHLWRKREVFDESRVLGS